MTDRDVRYYERRLAEERMRAEMTSCAIAKAVHHILVERYLLMLDQAEPIVGSGGDQDNGTLTRSA